MIRKIVYHATHALIKIRWYILGDYYARLGVQARYLYRQSQLFSDKWKVMGLDYAEGDFKGNIAVHFFNQAKKENIWIRGHILLDSILRRPAQPYKMRD